MGFPKKVDASQMALERLERYKSLLSSKESITSNYGRTTSFAPIQKQMLDLLTAEFITIGVEKHLQELIWISNHISENIEEYNNQRWPIRGAAIFLY